MLKIRCKNQQPKNRKKLTVKVLTQCSVMRTPQHTYLNVFIYGKGSEMCWNTVLICFLKHSEVSK